MENSILARLPSELRETIYDFTLSFSNREISINTVRHNSADPQFRDNIADLSRLSLLQLCRQVYREAIKRIYAENVFIFPSASNDSTPCNERLATFVSAIGDKNAANLREIHLAYTLLPGMFGKSNFRRSLKSIKETAQHIPSCVVKVMLTFFEVHKSIAIRVQLDLSAKRNNAGDDWIELCDPIAAPSDSSQEIKDSMDFLRSQLRECKKDIEAA